MARRFPLATLQGFRKTKYLYVRAGEHRFIPIWVVVVEDRVIVRSWNNKPEGWYRAFLRDSRGAVKIEQKEIAVRALRLRSARLNDAADDAYAGKYTSRSNAKYTHGFRSPRRKAATLELIPA